MTATLKTTIIQEPSSATANMTLDTSGGVAFGQNLSVAGTTTLTGGIASAGLPLKGASSGTTTLAAQSVASGTATLPAGTGTVAVNGVSTNIVTATSQASTSGTSIDFTSIPSWVKRITLMFNGVSTNGASAQLIRFGTSGGIVTTNYQSLGLTSNAGGNSTTASTAGFLIQTSSATHTLFGSYIFSLLGSNVWVGQALFNDSSAANMFPASGLSTLTLALTTVRCTTVNGTDTFDAGSINILYE